VSAATRWDADERRIFAASLIDSLGSGLFLPLSIIYLTRIVGLSSTRAGVGLAIAGLLGIVATPVSGWLIDRHGARAVVLGCYLASAAGFFAYPFVGSFGSFLAVAIAIQVSDRMEKPARTVLVLGLTSGERRTRALAWQRSTRNLGYGLGGFLAGAALLVQGRTPYDVVLVVNAVSFLTAGALISRVPVVHAAAATQSTRRGYRDVVRDRRYMTLAFSNALIRIHSSILKIAMPLWILTRTSAPIATNAILFALNTVLVVALQVPLTRSLSRRESLPRTYRRAGLSFAIACACYAAAAGLSERVAVALLAVAVFALTLGELQSAAAEWVASIDLAPATDRGRYLSVYKTTDSLQQAFGPALVTLVLTGGGRTGWLVLAAAMATGSVLSAHVTRNMGPELAAQLSSDPAGSSSAA
jgi:MFS family permease